MDVNTMTDLWRQVLRVDEVAPDADFFDYGGHSIVAALLVTRVQRDFGVDVAVEELYEHPAVEEFTALVSGRIAAGRARE